MSSPKRQAAFEPYRTIINLLREEMNDLCDSVAAGEANDMRQYGFMTGKIEGLLEAEQIVLDLDEAEQKANKS